MYLYGIPFLTWFTLFSIKGSSSVGAVNAPFLAAFSAATGKRSLQLSESEESDPDVSINDF